MSTLISRIYSVSIPKEESATSVPGNKPIWIDVGEDQLREALDFCREQTLNDKRSDLVLLYDGTLSAQLVGELDELRKPRKIGGYGWKKILPWESFVGGECDTVVYVGSGNLEAFSRARLKLMIITLSPNQSVSNYWRYNDALKSAGEKKLLETRHIESKRDISRTEGTELLEKTFQADQNPIASTKKEKK